MQKSSKLTVIVAGLSAAVMSLSACGGSTGSTTSSSSDSTNSIINVYGCEPQNPLLPTNTNEVCGGNPIDLLFAKLVAFDDKGNAKNEVAKEIKPSDGNKKYTITLNDGWKFTDGTPVTASSFTKAWSYGANLTNAQLSTSFFQNIKGYSDLQKKGVDKKAQLSGLKVIDDKTFTVELNAASSVFPTMVGYTAFAPLPDSFFSNPKSFGQKPVGNGPYKFVSWTHNDSIKLVKNKDYKGVAPAQNGGITFKMYTDTEPAYADVQGGQLDVLEQIPPSALKTFEKDSTVQAYNKPGSVTRAFTFPSNLFSLDSKEGNLRRQAISMSINREQICDKVLNGTGTPAVDFISPVIPGYSASLKGNSVLKYNPTEAKKLWAEANKISAWSDSDTVEFSYNTDGGQKDIFDALVNQIKNTLGVKAETKPIPTFSEFRANITARKMNALFRTGWQADYPSAEDYLTPLYSSAAADGKGSNDGDYKNADFDALLTKAAGSSDEAAANKDYQAAEELLFKDLPSVPLYYENASGVAAQGVKNFKMNWKNLPVYQELTK
jgi:oligopeptide transport system substrate-binding protein